ncbi:hypothetical protein K438DRAFT_2031933 [Mycena galopus ATCC 62051]|nr:hypothetical protein K438DRAFT_2031933 [Mycena galopus ATCC 62051]
MPPSAAKDRFTVLGIHPAPAHLSKSDFESKIETFLESILALPIAQKYILKTEIGEQFFQTKESAQLEGSSEGSGLSEPEPTMCIIKYELETLDHNIEPLHHARDADALQQYLGRESGARGSSKTPLSASVPRPRKRKKLYDSERPEGPADPSETANFVEDDT